MEKRKHGKSGYQILKERVAKLETKNRELQDTVDKQSTRISQLNVEIHNAETERIKEREAHKQVAHEMLEHMGWFRRLIWRLDHPEKK